MYKELVKAWLRRPIFQHFISSTEESFGLFANWAEKYSIFPRRGLLPSPTMPASPPATPAVDNLLGEQHWGTLAGDYKNISTCLKSIN